MQDRECVLLGALLQDLEKLYRRTGLSGPCELFVPEAFREAVKVAEEQADEIDAPPERLAPIVENIYLKNARKGDPQHTYRYPLKPLSMQYNEMMPKKAEEIEGDPGQDYRNLWQAFVEEMKQLQAQENFNTYVFTFYFLLKKYFYRVPSVETPDISFFDHARVTAAMADCRYCYRHEKGIQELPDPPEKEEPQFLLIEGEISGIRNFIYNALSPQQEPAGVAKRLRGCSFYVLLLVETLVDYLLKRLELSIVNQLWCCGGHFLIIAPNTPRITYRLKAGYQDINAFLVKKLYGELGCVLSWESTSEKELRENLYAVRQLLAANLAREKLRKLHNVLYDECNLQFASTPSARQDVTRSARFIAPVDSYVEELSKEQERIGTLLAHLSGRSSCRLAKLYEAGTDIQKKNFLTSFQIGESYQVTWMATPYNFQQADTIYLLNETKDFFKNASGKCGFKFIATHVDTYHTPGEVDWHNRNNSGDSVRLEDLKRFEDMARSGAGGFLGVLRMDVDHLGAIFSIGIQPHHLTRLVSLSSDMDLFFTGYLQQLCQSERFRKNTYIAYSGGDDLFVVGAWDRVLNLACQVRKDFKMFTCHNPDVNISGGLFLCKGNYPIHQAAKKTEYLLHNLARDNENREANLKGKITEGNAFAIFNHRIPWREFFELKRTGNEFIDALEHGKLTSTYFYKLLDLQRNWRMYRELNTARLYYITVRNVKDMRYRKRVIGKLARHECLTNQAYLPVLIGYTALKTGNK